MSLTTAANWSGVLPPTLTMTGCGSRAQRGNPATNAAAPGFSSPMALIMPEAVSITLGGGFPWRASSVTVFGT